MTPTAQPLAQPLHGRVALITGANTGIGLVTARELCRQGAQVFIACRSNPLGQTALQSIRSAVPDAKLDLLPLDLGNLDSVRACAAAFLAHGLPLHLLVNNAGLAGARGLTASGFELAFGTNHIGHFVLTQLLLERIKQSAPARIVTVGSRAHFRAPAHAGGFDWAAARQTTQTRTAIDEYSISKLANVLFSAELARRLQGSGVTTYSLHPGVVASDVWRAVPGPLRWLMKQGMINTEQGALTTLYCATSPDCALDTGLYYDKCKAKVPSAVAQDKALAAELWRQSEAWVG